MACDGLFNFTSKHSKEAAAKRNWLNAEPVRVANNLPLTSLLKNLTGLVRQQVNGTPTLPGCLTHEAFLACMDEALNASEWPEQEADSINSVRLSQQYQSKKRKGEGERLGSAKRASLLSRNYPFSSKIVF